MTSRIHNPMKEAPASIKAMIALEGSFAESGLDPLLIELVRLRASQINGCAYCIEMHVLTARKHGESDMRLHMLAGWRESSLYTQRERAALAWTESLTRLADTHAPDADYAAFSEAFSESEQVSITLLIGAINVWNRLNVGFRVPPAGVGLAAAA